MKRFLHEGGLHSRIFPLFLEQRCWSWLVLFKEDVVCSLLYIIQLFSWQFQEIPGSNSSLLHASCTMSFEFWKKPLHVDNSMRLLQAAAVPHTD